MTNKVTIHVRSGVAEIVDAPFGGPAIEVLDFDIDPGERESRCGCPADDAEGPHTHAGDGYVELATPSCKMPDCPCGHLFNGINRSHCWRCCPCQYCLEKRDKATKKERGQSHKRRVTHGSV
jgi:hypothetical protein